MAKKPIRSRWCPYKERGHNGNQSGRGHFHIRKVDADWSVDIKGKHMMIGQRIEFHSRIAELTGWNSMKNEARV